MKKIVILGVKGMAGHIMAEYLSNLNEYKIYGIARESGQNVSIVLDVLNFKALEQYFYEIKPDYVINCIGMLVSDSNNNLSTAIQINSYLPHFLSEIGEKINYKLIHISTDCVFSGKDGEYKENSFLDGSDNYARTKALGEVVNKKDLTIRTSIIGPELKDNGTGLFGWFLKQSGEINGYTNAYWSGVTTLELAKVVHQMIKQNISGLYHLCPKSKISKFKLLKLFKELWNIKVDIIPFEDYIIDKSLLCTRLDFSYNVPSYKKMLTELKVWMDNNVSYYLHYSEYKGL